MRLSGTIKSWNDDRGFGFIQPAQGGRDVFFHIKAFREGGERPLVGQEVTFDVEVTPDGKQRARSVALAGSPPPGARSRRSGLRPWDAASAVCLPAFLLIYCVATLAWRVPAWVAGLYVVASLAAFSLYASDKSAAGRGSWRISESTLLMVGLVGGWPGAIIAQQTLRHKSSKASFRVQFWGTVVLNVLAFLIAVSPAGQAMLRDWLHTPSAHPARNAAPR